MTSGREIGRARAAPETVLTRAGPVVVVGFDIRDSRSVARIADLPMHDLYRALHQAVGELLDRLVLRPLVVTLQGDGGFILVRPTYATAAAAIALGLDEWATTRFGSHESSGLVVACAAGPAVYGETVLFDNTHPVFAGEVVNRVAEILKRAKAAGLYADASMRSELGLRPSEEASPKRRPVELMPQFERLDAHDRRSADEAIADAAKAIRASAATRYGYEVEVVPLDAEVDRFRVLREALASALNVDINDIERIGSTGLLGAWGKPILDVIVRVPTDLSSAAVVVADWPGYVVIPTPELTDRVVVRELDAAGRPITHVHLLDPRAWASSRERRFRQLLVSDTLLLDAYSATKRWLASRVAGTPEDYGALKDEFIRWATRIALRRSSEDSVA